MVSVDSLTKTYGPQKAIDALSFEVNRGEILGFLGPNGAGKSTTMKILTGFLPPSSGSATVDGYNVQTNPLAVRRKVGYLPEHNPLYLDMYVHEFLHFTGRIYRLGRKQLQERVPEVIAQTGLAREQHKKIGALSKGYRQRVGLCQALIHDPEVLILDEPTTGLDPNQIIDIRELIRQVGRDKTVIFSSHILSEVESIADRVIIVNQGQMVANEPPKTLCDRLSEEVVMCFEVARPDLDLSPILALPGVKTAEAEAQPGHFAIHTERDLDIDIRSELFRLCVDQGNPMLGLFRKKYTLEEAFRKLTHGH